MLLGRRITLAVGTQLFLLTYYLCLVSISSDYWSNDGENHEGLWMKCLYNTKLPMERGNEKSLSDIVCCSSRSFKDHIGAAGFFFVLQLLLDTTCIIIWFIWLFSRNRDYEEVKYGVGVNIVPSAILMIIVMIAYGGGGPKPLGWSFHLLLSAFFLRIPCYITLCFALS